MAISEMQRRVLAVYGALLPSLFTPSFATAPRPRPQYGQNLSAACTLRRHGGQVAFSRHWHRGQKPKLGSTTAVHCGQFEVSGLRRTKYNTMTSACWLEISRSVQPRGLMTRRHELM